MKIAIFRDGPLFPATTGGAYVINNFLNFLSKKGLDVVLIRCYRGWEKVTEYKDKPYQTVLIRPEEYYDKLHYLARIIDDFGVDIVQLDSTEATILQGAYLKQKTNAKIVYEAHNIDSVLLDRLKFNQGVVCENQRFEKESAKVADRVLVRSDFDKSCLKKLGINVSKVDVCPTGVDPKSVAYSKNRSKNKTVLFLGNLDYQPNETAVDIICEQIAPAVHKKDPSILFCIVGKGGDRLAKKYDLPNVKFTGALPTLDKVFNESFVALCPLIEGSGTRLKVLDYLAAGIPVISSSLGVEGLEEEIYRVVSVEDDFENYVDLILQLYGTDTASRSERGLRFINKYRSWDSIIQLYIDSYKHVMKERS